MENPDYRIKTGTMIRVGKNTAASIERFLSTGIETVQFFFWGTIPAEISSAWADEIRAVCDKNDLAISALSLFADPFYGNGERSSVEKDWNRLIELAERSGVSLITGFTGRVPGKTADESVNAVADFFSPVIEKIHAKGMALAFENCPMGGSWHNGGWNIAFCPSVWEMLFKDKFKSASVGLEFDPSHCIGYNQPVLELLNSWMPFIKHVHAKDAVPLSPLKYADGWLGSRLPYEERFPGEGSVDWVRVYDILYREGYEGSVDIEGYHSKFISHELEVENQKRCFNYLTACREKSYGER